MRARPKRTPSLHRAARPSDNASMSVVRVVLHRLPLVLLLTVLGAAHVATAQAQTVLGTFSWKLQPFCNTVSVQVTQEGATYRLAGWEDGCGGVVRQPVQGTVSPNLDGTLSFLLATATAGGVPVTTSVRFDVGSLGGTWTDSAGNSGAFVLGAPAGGSPRPLGGSGLAPSSVTTTTIVDGTIGGVDVNSAQVQLRVSGSCPAGQAMRSVAVSGTVVCQPVSPAQIVWVATSGGDFTSVNAAMAAITDASATKPYVVRVAPGIYDEPGGVTVKDQVSLVGSGRGATTIRCACGGATYTSVGAATVRIEGAITSEVSDLRVVNTGAGAYAAGVLVSNTASSPVRLRRLAVMASGGSAYALGIASVGASPVIEQVEVTASGSAVWGISVEGTSSPVIDGVTATVSGTGDTRAVMLAGVGTSVVRNSVITATGVSPTAVFLGGTGILENVTAAATGSSLPNGVMVFGATATMRGLTVTSTSTAGTAYGIRTIFNTAVASIHGSIVTGSPSVAASGAGTVRVANTQLIGATSGAPTCVGVYSSTFGAFTCT